MEHYSWTSEEDEDESVPPRFKNGSMEALCKRIIKLEMENDVLRTDNFILRSKLDEKKNKIVFTPSPPPSSSSPKKIEYRVCALPLAFAKLGGGALVSYHPYYL